MLDVDPAVQFGNPKWCNFSSIRKGGGSRGHLGSNRPTKKPLNIDVGGKGGSIDGTNSAMQELQAMDSGGATFLPSTVPTEDSSQILHIQAVLTSIQVTVNTSVQMSITTSIQTSMDIRTSKHTDVHTDVRKNVFEVR
jgi:hypothetical protein